MSFTAILNISGQSYTVLQADYSFIQATDHYGKPKNIPDGGLIYLTIESTGDISILRWMLSDEMINEGEIIYMKRETMAAMRKVKFSNGFCVNFREIFDANNEEPMKIIFCISCSKMTIDGQDFDKSAFWGNSGTSGGKNKNESVEKPAPKSSATEVNSFIPD